MWAKYTLFLICSRSWKKDPNGCLRISWFFHCFWSKRGKEAKPVFKDQSHVGLPRQCSVRLSVFELSHMGIYSCCITSVLLIEFYAFQAKCYLNVCRKLDNYTVNPFFYRPSYDRRKFWQFINQCQTYSDEEVERKKVMVIQIGKISGRLFCDRANLRGSIQGTGDLRGRRSSG